MMDMKVSIITVSYNSARTIEKTIQSVLNQTYRNIEYIVIDGESTDGTAGIIKKYEDSLSYYVSEPDAGLYDAMNKGIRRATGDIIGIINSDDWYESDAVAKVVQCFTYKDAELVYGKACFVDEKGNLTYSRNRALDCIWYSSETVLHPTVFVKRGVYKKYGIFNTDYKIAADYDLLLRFYAKKVKFQYIDEIISYFRQGGISSSNYLQGNEEGRKISLTYINQCSERSFVLEQIERNYNLTKLIPIIEKKPYCVCDFLKEQIPNIKEGVIIFGTGIWSERLRYILRIGRIPILMFVDNNMTLWNTMIDGIVIDSPEKLVNYKGYLIIAVRDGQKEICEQLSGLSNEELNWITLDDIWHGVIRQ